MKLIKYENYTITVADEAYLIAPIRRMFNKDRTVTKEIFFRQMSVLYFVYDPRSNYSYIIDENSRLDEVLLQEGIDRKDWEKKYCTEDFLEAKDIYIKAIMTVSQRLLNTARIAVDKLGKYLESIDLSEEDSNGKPKYDVSKITAATDKLPKLAESISAMEKNIIKEIEDNSKARGNAELSLLDNNLEL